MDKSKLKTFVNTIFSNIVKMRNSDIYSKYDVGYWKRYNESPEFPNYETAENELINIVNSKSKSEFLYNCSKLVKTNVLPFFADKRNKIVIWSNSGLEICDDRGEYSSILVRDNNYSEYLSYDQSPIYIFIWDFVGNIIQSFQNLNLQNKTGISEETFKNSFLGRICEEQLIEKQNKLIKISKIIANQIYFESLLVLLKNNLSKESVLKEIKEITMKFKTKDFGKTLFNELLINEKSYLKNDNGKFICNIAKLGEIMISLFSKELTKISINHENNFTDFKKFSLFDQILCKVYEIFEKNNNEILTDIFNSFLEPYSQIPFDQILSESFVNSIPDDKLKYTKIEFGQNTMNSFKKVIYGPEAVAHINPNNIMANFELPILLARVGEYNAKLKFFNKQKMKLSSIATDIHPNGEHIGSYDKLVRVCPKITLQNSIFKDNRTNKYNLVFSKPNLDRNRIIMKNDTVEINIQSMLNDFENKTKDNNLKRLSLCDSKKIIMDNISKQLLAKH